MATSPQSPPSLLSRWSALERATLALMGLSLLLLAWQALGMNTALGVFPHRSHRVWAESDAQEGGNSVATVKTGAGFQFRCTVQEASKLPFPYCNVFVELSPDGTGVDLSHYHSVVITLRHRSTRPDNLKLFLNHFYPDAGNAKYPFKLNIYRLATTGGRQTVSIPIGDFFVPSWWLCQSQTENPKAEFGNVKHFGISSGESTRGGQIEVDVERIELRGKWIEADALQRWLLYGWLTWIVGLLAFKTYRLSHLSTRWRAQSQELASHNADLIVKRDHWAHQAQHDALTGLLNRAGLQAVLDQAQARHLDAGEQCSLLLIDIDHFKRINDEFGHDQGDLVLQRFAKLLGERSRASDAVGRWGGEEFLIVCPGTPQPGALAFAEALVRATPAAPLLDARPVTCSIGVAQLAGADLKAALRQADEALYQAKGGGRNRAVAWSAA